MKINQLFTLVAVAIMLNARQAFADDSLIITLPGQAFTNAVGNVGTPALQTDGTAFTIKIHACTDSVSFITDTSFSGVKTVSYTGPSGGVSYVTSVTFVAGTNTTTLTTIITNVQTTTISATATGALTPVASSSLTVNDDSLFITLPGETFVNTAGNAGTPANQIVGAAFAVKIHATTDNVNDITDTNFSGVKTITYSGPTGGITYVTNVTFVNGAATNNLTVTNAQTTTISATAAGAMTPVASSSLLVAPKLIVTLPGQTFTAGTGNTGTVSGQTAGVSFNITSLTAVNADFTVDTAFDSTSIGDQTLSYFGPANAPSGGGTPTYTTTVTFANGVSTTPLATTLVAAQTTTIMASNAVVGTVASSSLTVAANPTAAQLAFSTQPGSGQPGVVWFTQPAVALQDTYGNGPVTNAAQNVTLAIQNNPGSGTLSGTATVAVNINTGVATFSGLSINNAGLGYTLTATGNTVSTSPGTVISSPFLIRVLTFYDNAILGDSPEAYWPMQENSGTAIYDATTNRHDGVMYVSTDVAGSSQGHSVFVTNNSGFILGNTGLLAAFPSQKAIYFDTVNKAGAEIAVPYATNLDTQVFSAECWLRIPNFPVGYVGDLSGQSNNMLDQCVLGPNKGGNSGTQSGWIIDVQSDHLNNATNANPAAGRVDTWVAKGGGWGTILTATNENAQVVHIAMTYDGTSLRQYNNGILQATVASTHKTQLADFQANSTHGLRPFVMGSYQNSYFDAVNPWGGTRQRFYVGDMSHVAVYTNVLTASQILNHYLIGILGGTNPPTIGTQPVSWTNYTGYNHTFSVAAGGTPPLHYQWYTNGTALGRATNASLVLNNLKLANAGNYRVTITNFFGSTNSDTVSLTVLSLPSDAYQAAIISGLPQAFYPLHETNGTTANDLIDPVDNNGRYVTYDTNMPVLLGQPGPSTYLGTAVTLNPAVTNGITITKDSAMGIVGPLTLEAWVKVQDTFNSQWIVAHGPYLDGNPSKTDDRLVITNGNYFAGWYSDKPVPTDYGAYFAIPDAPGTWVYLAGVADGTYWRLYENGVDVSDTLDTNVPPGAISANGGWAIGGRWDPGSVGLINPSLNGSINNVAIYDYALTPTMIQQHYQIGITGVYPPLMSLHKSGTNVIVGWTSGYLQEATNVIGSWTYDDTNTVTSPYTVPATNAAKFYRVTLTPP